MIKYTKKDLSRLYNVGDHLCTPDNYFDVHSEADITIVGGGVWDIEKLSEDLSAEHTVLWGAGRSVRYPAPPTKIGQMNFLAWGARDRDDLIDHKNFLPCVSCLNRDVMSKPSGNRTLVFTNANTVVSPAIVHRDPDKTYLTNSCSVEDLLAAWNQSSKIITNSYHGIYWGLLSGREVVPFGYSSKFTNVTGIFDIDFPPEQLYSASKTASMLDLLGGNATSVQLSNPDTHLDRFRTLNMEFASKLREVGIQCKIL